MPTSSVLVALALPGLGRQAVWIGEEMILDFGDGHAAACHQHGLTGPAHRSCAVLCSAPNLAATALVFELTLLTVDRRLAQAPWLATGSG